MFILTVYGLILSLFILSFSKSRQKTITALNKGWTSLEKILPLFLSVILTSQLLLAYLPPAAISSMLGKDSGWIGVMLAAFIGSVTLIPGVITFPLAATLLEKGAGLFQVIIFISTSTMVGIMTLPAEIQYFGKKTALVRNFLSLLFSFAIALVLKEVLS